MRALFVVVLVLLVAAACSAAAVPTPTSPSRAPAATPTRAPDAVATGTPAPGQQRMIVRNADLTLMVTDVMAAVDQVAQVAGQVGGYVASSSLSGQQEAQPRATVGIRVPVERFDEALAELRRLAVRVLAENTSSQDVTEEYVDLEARRRNLEATETQLQKLLDRATTVDDVLKVQRELTNVRGEIERIQGRMQYLERVAAESTITVRLEPVTTRAPIVQRGWSPIETFKDAARGFISGGQDVVDFVIRLAVFAPFWAPPVALTAWLMWWINRRYDRRR